MVIKELDRITAGLGRARSVDGSRPMVLRRLHERNKSSDCTTAVPGRPPPSHSPDGGRATLPPVLPVAAPPVTALPVTVERITSGPLRPNAHTVRAKQHSAAPVIVTAVQPPADQSVVAAAEPMAAPRKLLAPSAVLSRLRASWERANSRARLSSACVWRATSIVTIMMMTRTTDLLAKAATTKAPRASTHAAPVAGSDQPRSCRRPARSPLRAPARPANPNIPITCTGYPNGGPLRRKVSAVQNNENTANPVAARISVHRTARSPYDHRAPPR